MSKNVENQGFKRPARLVEANDGKWYVVFYPFDAKKGKHVRKRDYSINVGQTKAEKRQLAAQLCRDLDQLIAEGFVMNASYLEKDSAPDLEVNSPPVLEPAEQEPMDLALKASTATARKSTAYSYTSAHRIFTEWAQSVGLDKRPARRFGKQEMIRFLDYTLTERGVSNTTYNNYITQLRTLFNRLVELFCSPQTRSFKSRQ